MDEFTKMFKGLAPATDPFATQGVGCPMVTDTSALYAIQGVGDITPNTKRAVFGVTTDPVAQAESTVKKGLGGMLLVLVLATLVFAGSKARRA